MTPTHRKISYNATCYQWREGENKGLIMTILRDNGVEVSPFGEELFIRYLDGRSCCIDTMRVGDWVLVCENGEIKMRTDAKFTLEYESI